MASSWFNIRGREVKVHSRGGGGVGHLDIPFVIIDFVPEPRGVCHGQLEPHPLLLNHMTDGADLDSLRDRVGGRGAGSPTDLGLEQGVNHSRLAKTTLP